MVNVSSFAVQNLVIVLELYLFIILSTSSRRITTNIAPHLQHKYASLHYFGLLCGGDDLEAEPPLDVLTWFDRAES